MQPRPVGLILIFLALGLAGQILFKAGMSLPDYQASIDRLGGQLQVAAQGSPGALGRAGLEALSLFLKPYVLGGLACYVASTVCWLAVLSRTELSFAYPMLSLGYLAVLLIGWARFGETVSALRWMGVTLISVGLAGIYSERSYQRGGRWFALALAGMAGFLVLLPQVDQTPPPALDKPMALILVSIALGLIGQFMFKAGMNRPAYQGHVGRLGQSLRALGRRGWRALPEASWLTVSLFLRPYILGGGSCYALSTGCWLAILSRTPLSFAYPMLSLGYVAILLMGRLWFGERVTLFRWMGVALICVGIVTLYSEELVRGSNLLFAAGLAAFAGLLALAAQAGRRRPTPA